MCKHCYSCHPEVGSRHVRIEIDFIKEGIQFEIIDEGPAFDIVSYQEPALEELIKNKNKGGIGIMLVKNNGRDQIPNEQKA